MKKGSSFIHKRQTDRRIEINLLRHVSILDARVEKLEVAGKKVPTRQVVGTAT